MDELYVKQTHDVEEKLRMACESMTLHIHVNGGWHHFEVPRSLAGIRIHAGPNVHQKNGTGQIVGNLSLLAPLE